MLFFWNFLWPIGLERNAKIILILSLSHPFPTYFGLKWIRSSIFLIFCVFLLFFWIFQLRIKLERNGTIIFIFSLFQHFQHILAWNDRIMVFFNIFNFFAIFLKISIMHRVGTERNGTIIFIFSLSHHFPTYFGLKWICNGIF